MLIFARTATRGRELSVRTALGAGRLRIISQIFTESFVLAVLAAGVGVFGVTWSLERAVEAVDAELPYWLDLGVTPEALVWALGLATLSAVVAGVVPALRITGKHIRANIQRARSATAGTRFGGVTTALIVGDVAIAVTVATIALGLSDMIREVLTDESLVGIPAEEYLAVEVQLPVDETGSSTVGFDEARFSARLADVHRTLVERLEAEPGIRSVAAASVLPRMDHSSRLVQVETSDTGTDGPLGYVRTAAVTVEYFDRLDRPALLGRTFTVADAGDVRTAVIVNTEFVDEWLGGEYPIGRRLRFRVAGDDSPTPWREIVGVVGHLGVNVATPGGESAIYVPVAPGEIHPIRLAVHVGDAPLTLAPRVREIVTEVEPTAILAEPASLDTVMQGDFYLMLAGTAGFVLLVGVLVVLAASSLHAIMSFAVSERTREIGIRTALGARPSTIVLTIVRRAMFQIGIGVLLALPLAARLFLDLRNESDEAISGAEATLLALGVGLSIVVVIALFACTVPTLRALRIEPTEALRAE
jgi:predicted permease